MGDFSYGKFGRMTKTVKVVFDGSIFRPSGPVNLEAEKIYHYYETFAGSGRCRTGSCI